jgi:hypothetical protein
MSTHPLSTKNRFTVLSIAEMTESDLISSTDSAENDVQAVLQLSSPVQTSNTVSLMLEPTPISAPSPFVNSHSSCFC